MCDESDLVHCLFLVVLHGEISIALKEFFEFFFFETIIVRFENFFKDLVLPAVFTASMRVLLLNEFKLRWLGWLFLWRLPKIFVLAHFFRFSDQFFVEHIRGLCVLRSCS